LAEIGKPNCAKITVNSAVVSASCQVQSMDIIGIGDRRFVFESSLESKVSVSAALSPPVLPSVATADILVVPSQDEKQRSCTPVPEESTAPTDLSLLVSPRKTPMSSAGKLQKRKLAQAPVPLSLLSPQRRLTGSFTAVLAGSSSKINVPPLASVVPHETEDTTNFVTESGSPVKTPSKSSALLLGQFMSAGKPFKSQTVYASPVARVNASRLNSTLGATVASIMDNSDSSPISGSVQLMAGASSVAATVSTTPKLSPRPAEECFESTVLESSISTETKPEAFLKYETPKKQMSLVSCSKTPVTKTPIASAGKKPVGLSFSEKKVKFNLDAS
jgi:hypothetical protein